MEQFTACGSRSMLARGLRRYVIGRNNRSSEHSIGTEPRQLPGKSNDQHSNGELRPPTQGAGTLLSGSRSLPRKQPLLPLQPPAISCERPICSNDSMTRNGDRDGIAGTGSSHGTSGRRLPDRARDLSIGPGLSARNLLQRLPHLALKRRRLHVQREGIYGGAPVEARETITDIPL